MPENTETPVDVENTPTTEDTQDAPKGNKEAQYRVQRNEARAALEAAQSRIDNLLRLDIERIASETLAAPVDFWLSSNSVADYLTDGCLVDAARVREDAQLLVTERPGLRKPSLAVDPTQGSGYGTPGKGDPSWGRLLAD